MSKYHNQKVLREGIVFSSLLEADVYLFLKRLETQGRLKKLHLQPKVYLTLSRILYKPDFYCEGHLPHESFYVEAKGFETSVWKMKKKLWMDYGPAPLQIYKRKGRHLFLDELLTPTSLLFPKPE